jgi:CheY-like chemotaxis protein
MRRDMMMLDFLAGCPITKVVWCEETGTEQTRVWGKCVDEMARTRTNGAVLILSKRGPLCDSLQSFLATASWIEGVYVADTVQSALQAVTLHRPALVLIAEDLPAGGISTVLQWIEAEGSCSRSLVLAEDGERRQRALTLGADAALLKGFPAAKLLRVIERLVTTPHNPDGLRIPGGGKVQGWRV